MAFVGLTLTIDMFAVGVLGRIDVMIIITYCYGDHMHMIDDTHA